MAIPFHLFFLQGLINMRFVFPLLATLTVLSMTTPAWADFDVVPYQLNGRLVTGGEDDVTGEIQIAERVYGYNFDEVQSHPFIITDPGFNNGTSFTVGVFPGDGLLPASKDLEFTLLTNLQYWDGTGSVSFAAAPALVSLGLNHDLVVDGSSFPTTPSVIGNTGRRDGYTCTSNRT